MEDVAELGKAIELQSQTKVHCWRMLLVSSWNSKFTWGGNHQQPREVTRHLNRCQMCVTSLQPSLLSMFLWDCPLLLPAPEEVPGAILSWRKRCRRWHFWKIIVKKVNCRKVPPSPPPPPVSLDFLKEGKMYIMKKFME